MEGTISLRMAQPGDEILATLQQTLRYEYESEFYYDVEERESAAGVSWALVRKPASPKIQKTSDLEIFAQWTQDSRGYVAYISDEPAGYCEFGLEEWCNLVRTYHFVVIPKFKRRGIGSAMMQLIIRSAHELHARGVILETQSCNAPAIDFYRANGFTFWGLNTAAYTNADVDHREVWLWMGMKF